MVLRIYLRVLSPGRREDVAESPRRMSDRDLDGRRDMERWSFYVTGEFSRKRATHILFRLSSVVSVPPCSKHISHVPWFYHFSVNFNDTICYIFETFTWHSLPLCHAHSPVDLDVLYVSGAVLELYFRVCRFLFRGERHGTWRSIENFLHARALSFSFLP